MYPHMNYMSNNIFTCRKNIRKLISAEFLRKSVEIVAFSAFRAIFSVIGLRKGFKSNPCIPS